MPDEHGNDWLIYTFIATTERRRLTINWEHDAYRWTIPDRVKRFSNRVRWLDDVLAVVGHGRDDLPSAPGGTGSRNLRSHRKSEPRGRSCSDHEPQDSLELLTRVRYNAANDAGADPTRSSQRRSCYSSGVPPASDRHDRHWCSAVPH
jgi:hypothetical protein